jgi:hypothetical protein
MPQRLTEKAVERAKGPRILYDSQQVGLGLKATARGR